MKVLIAGLVIVLAFLQYELWFSDNGVRQYFALKHAVNLQEQENLALLQRNHQLTSDITNLKHDREATEEHARNDLGMVKPDETFYQIVGPSKA
ncbi:MAG TPA: septum formation initiator family protein [Gammaproteobacteria bacterium]|nr:septum formation initiator family protein [Gammaproteobacteria bacterium]